MANTAVFVEGQTELIFVREFLKKKYSYIVNIECTCLIADEMCSAEYDYTCPTTDLFFKLINVGNDEAVLSQLLLREEKLYNSGFDRIIGLRDMYSRKYKKYANQVDEGLIIRFIEETKKTIETKAKDSNRITFLYSIMEIESWILAFDGLLEKMHKDLTPTNIKAQTLIDLDLDPEETIFHPASALNKIFEIVGQSYDKSKHHVEAIVSKINDKEAFDLLYNKPVCASYNLFYDHL